MVVDLRIYEYLLVGINQLITLVWMYCGYKWSPTKNGWFHVQKDKNGQNIVDDPHQTPWAHVPHVKFPRGVTLW